MGEKKGGSTSKIKNCVAVKTTHKEQRTGKKVKTPPEGGDLVGIVGIILGGQDFKLEEPKQRKPRQGGQHSGGYFGSGRGFENGHEKKVKRKNKKFVWKRTQHPPESGPGTEGKGA